MLTTKIFNYLQILILSFLIQNGAYAITASDEEEIISVVNAQLMILKKPIHMLLQQLKPFFLIIKSLEIWWWVSTKQCIGQKV